jgi:hypothetical protein
MFVCFMLFINLLRAQQNQSHYYYIKEATVDILKPNAILENNDGTLLLDFGNENLTSFFENFTIYSYSRIFDWSTDPKYHKYYMIGLDSDNKAENLRNNSNVIFSEYIGTLEEQTLGSPPDDYFDHVTISGFDQSGCNGYIYTPNPKGYEHLELVNARRAWNITQGNTNVIIGIRDVEFVNSHPDIDDKIVVGPGASNGNNSNFHGLSYNYVLNATNTSQLIPVDQLQQGTYIVNLVVNGEILDTKNLLIN